MSAGVADRQGSIAAARKARPGCVGGQQLRAVVEAARWAGVSAGDVRRMMVTVTGVDELEDLTPEAWADLMDHFVVMGFRHPAVPTVTAVQVAAIGEARRQAGLDARSFVKGLREVIGVRSRRHLDGLSFGYTMEWLTRMGARVTLPGHGFMTRSMVRLVHEAAYAERMDVPALRDHLVRFGGVLHAGDLDRRGFMRLLIAFDKLGMSAPAPAPTVPGDPGMVTQAQVNLIWRLWLDIGGWKGDVTPAALDAAIGSLLGMEGGLATLTRAGARAVIDHFMVPRLNDRQSAQRSG